MASEVDLQLIATSMHAIAGTSSAGASPELVSVPMRRKAAAEGRALQDGSFPIRNVADLQRAVQAYGRAKNKPRAKRFIMTRARELKREDLIPDGWKQSPKKTFELAGITILDLLLPEAPDPHCGEFVEPPGPCSLNRSPKLNWVEKVGGLPNYICQVAQAIARGGRTLDSAIPIAISAMKKWAAGAQSGGAAKGGKAITPAVRARAAAAVAQWEAMRVRAKAQGHLEADLEELSEEDMELVDLIVNAEYDFAGKPAPKPLPRVPNQSNTSGNRKKALPAAERPEDKKATPGVGNSRKRGPYHSTGKTITRNKRKVRLRLDDKPDGRSLRTNYKRYPATAPAGLGGQFAPIGRGVKATKKKYGTAASLEENMTTELAGLPFNVQGVLKQIANISKMTDAQLVAAASTLGKAPNTPEIVKATQTVAAEIQKRGLGTKKAAPAPPPPAAKGKAAAEVEVEELAVGDTVVIKEGPYKGKQGRIVGTAPKKAQQMVRVAGRVAAVNKDICEKKQVVITASGAALWDEDAFTYYWDEKSDSTFRIAEEDSSVQVFDGSILDWTGTDLAADEVTTLPQVEDSDSLEALVGAGEPEVEEEEEKPEEAPPVEQVKETADLTADTKEDVETPEGSGEGGGPRFRIPLLVPEGKWSGDRRRFAKDSLEFKKPPFPLLWQKETDEGHKRSVVVGRIDKAERLEHGGIGNIEGVFDTHVDAVEAARQVKGKFVTGVSGDVDKFDHELAQDNEGHETINIKHGRVVAATIVAKPAFQEATIEVVPEEGEEALVASGAPGAGPLQPSQSWFQPPKMAEPYLFTVEDDGRCHGLIAEWGTLHTGNPQWKPPHNFSGYRYFNRKPVRTAEGTDIRCGQLTLTGGHAELGLDPDNVIRHYDDTRSAVADVVVGENEFGIWAAGALRPDVSPEQIRAFRASEPSGDWRMRDGELELLAVCMVNTAGFPVMPRALVASGDKVVALVAAGMSSHIRRVDVYQQVDRLTALVEQLQAKLDERITSLETESETRRRMELAASIHALRA